jgi:hypothetical protein
VVSLACVLGIHVIAAAGLNIMTGYTGLISLGHAAFMGVGCYTAAWFAQRGVPFLLTLPLAGLFAAALGIVVGMPSLRIKGLYLAVATLAMQFLLVYVFREWESVTGGVRGVNVPPASLFGFELDTDQRMVLPDRGLRGAAAGRWRATCSARASAAPSSPSATRTSRPRCWASTCCATSCRLRHRLVLRRRGRRAAGLLLPRDDAGVLHAAAVDLLPGGRSSSAAWAARWARSWARSS